MTWIVRANLMGPTGTIDTATATALPTTAQPTVTLGGTPAHRSMAFGIPRANSVVSSAIRGDGHLIVTLLDGQIIDTGMAQGPQGLAGVNAVDNDTAVAGYINTTGASQTQTAADSRYDSVVAAKGRGVSHLNSAAVNTPLLKAAIIAAEAVGGTLVLPAVPMGATIDIDDVLPVATGGIRIRGAGKYQTHIRQTAFPKSVFDVTGPNVTVEDMWFDQSPFTVTAGDISPFVRGEPGTVRSSGVWVGADNVVVRNVHATNIVSAVSVIGWDIPGDVGRQLAGCEVHDVTCENVVFGLLVHRVAGFMFSGIRGRYKLLTGITTPPHLVYVSNLAGENSNVVGSDCLALNGEYSFAYQIKGVTGGSFTNLHANTSTGVLHVMDSVDLQFKNVVSVGDASVDSLAGSIEFEGSNARITVDGFTVNLAGDGKAVRLSDTTTDSVLRNGIVLVAHTTDKTADVYDVEIRGTNNTAENVSVTNIGASTWHAGIGVWGGSGHRIIAPKSKGEKVGVRIRGAFPDIIISDYDLDDLTGTQYKIDTALSATKKRPRVNQSTEIGANRTLAFDTGDRPTGTLTNGAGVVTTAGTGQAWEQFSGIWVADGSHIYNSQAVNSAVLVLNAGQADVEISAGIKYLNREALVLRAIDITSMLTVKLNHLTGMVEICKGSNTAPTVLASAAFVPTVGRRYHLIARAFGAQIDVSIDGRWYLTHTLVAGDQTTYGAATKHGLTMNNNTAGKFDNFQVKSLS